MNKHSTRLYTICMILILLIAAIIGAQAAATKNVILMIGDGMGPQHVKAGGYYVNGASGTLCFEPYYKGTVTTRSLNSAITDSAAAATTMATGHKTNNGIISQAPDGTTYQTILEQAKAMGKSTGLVTTDYITGATPAGFGAHDADRNNYIPIAGDYINSSKPNIIMGGGGTTSGGSGFISTIQIAGAQAAGYQTIYNKTQMDALSNSSQHVLGLFNASEMTYEYDRTANTTEPHLSEMASKALSILSTDSDGFFVMIEQAKIDKASHSNDMTRLCREVSAFNDAVQTVLTWMAGRTDTLLIVTADHETGGLTATNKGKGVTPGATWTSLDHTATNVPLYALGSNSNLIDGYMSGGVMDDTNIYNTMYRAYTIPEPSSIAALLCGLAGIAWRRRRRT
jgi:alkaline phosphatase